MTQSREYGRASWRKEPCDCISKTAKDFSRRNKLVGFIGTIESIFCVKMLIGGVLGVA